MTEENYISLISAKSSRCKHGGHEYFCETIFLVKHKTSQSCESTVLLTFHQTLLMTIGNFNFFYNITQKAVISDAQDTLLLGNLDKPWYLQCNEHNNVPIPIPTYDYTVTNMSSLSDCQLHGGNEFLHESLASCLLQATVQKHVLHN